MVVHPHPHPKQFEVLLPSNPEIAKKFGQVRVEDWDDRVRGETWTTALQHSAPDEVAKYVKNATGKGPSVHGEHTNEVVRCHSTATGELILLHDDWL